MSSSPGICRAQVVKSMFAVVGLVLIFVQGTKVPSEREKVAARDIQVLMNQIRMQEQIESFLLQEMETGEYSWENPFVVVDPYGVCPLSALVFFTSEEPLSIRVAISNGEGEEDFSFSFEILSTKHLVPVYGLFPGERNQVFLEARTETGETRERVIEIPTAPLPESVRNLGEVVKNDESLRQPGFNFSWFDNPKTIFDGDGVIRWFLNIPALGTSFFKANNGKFFFCTGSYYFGDLVIWEMNLLGRISQVVFSPFGAHHDMAFFDDVRLLVTGSDSGKLVEDLLYEVNWETGEVTIPFDLKKVLDPTRDSPGFSEKDWLHLNSIVPVPDENALLLSGRNQSAVVKVHYPSGELQWILGEHQNWDEPFQRFLLNPTGDVFEWPFSQHAPEILTDQDENPETMDILLFDNGHGRFHREFGVNEEREMAENPWGEYSRLVQFRVNEKEKTVEQVWQYGEGRKSLFSAIMGDADQMQNGNVLGTFDVSGEESVGHFVEVDPKSNEVLWEVVWNNDVYRLDRLPLYYPGSEDIPIGEPIKNCIPKEVRQKYGAE